MILDPTRQARVSEPVPFDLTGPLPTGTTVLEASAGTGKTYTIAALAARYLADGLVELDQLMLVTFGRMATNELRDRVRERLVRVEQRLATVIAGGEVDGDEVERLICTGATAELKIKHGRIARARADFDAATIATTHEFCLRMLDGLGVIGDREPDAIFVEHLTDLVRQATGDIYLRRYASGAAVAPLPPDQALRLAETVVNAPHAELVPRPSPEQGPDGWGDASAEQVDFALEVRAEVARRKGLGRLFSYDDMLTRLHRSLTDPDQGEAACDRLRQRFRVVLIDEFQDTDPIQWDIVRTAFHGHATLIMIGDPKQAIYAFRGADVFSYLDAVRVADTIATLDVNRRSDAALVDAAQSLFGGAALGDERIVVRPVRAHHAERRLLLGDTGELPAPVRLRVLEHDPEASRMPMVRTVRPKITKDLVADVTRLIASRVRLRDDEDDHEVGPGDIAVLVRRNRQAEAIRDALTAAGVPAVVLGATSVFGAAMAREWLTLLRALEQPRQARVRSAALTCFVGWTVGDLARADEPTLTELSQQIRWWSRTLDRRGVAALLETMITDTAVGARLLGQVDGERQLTDLRHIGQTLHAAMVSGRLGVTALVEYLVERIADAGRDGTEGTRRLESDSKAVQILTVHRSKGLEFPIVYLPEAWDRYVGDDEGQVLQLHQELADDDHEGSTGRLRAVLDVGGLTGPGRTERLAQARREDGGDDLRLLYVAATRAKCQLITWWAPTRNTPPSALQRLLYGPRIEGVEPEQSYPVTDDPRSLSHLGAGISVELVEPRQPASPAGGPEPPSGLEVRAFDRALDLMWRRTSYSGLTAAAHGMPGDTAGVGSEAEPTKEDDEATAALALGDDPIPTAGGSPADDGLDRASPMSHLPSGADFGTVVHAIFEAVDPTADDLEAELRRATGAELSRVPAGTMTADGLIDGLLPTYDTPLGPLADDRRLRDFGTADRLAELDFEFPLAGGDQPTGELMLPDLAPLLRRHLPPNDPLIDYPDQLELPELAQESLRGYLVGSIDAVLRAGTPEAPRYLVVDYKTNWIGEPVDELPLRRYQLPSLARAMIGAHYPLQALLYSVALHRYLRWRQPDYRPDDHLGGVLYLFLRGMAGPDTPATDGIPCGVFSWRPPPAMITELSDLLDRGRS
ncbi:UvrD-helicase domain-containing protein [Microlunatus speluncae]|uniref:UvrD-helicase domain-containing protein n=1 Tax=Microlunatus speluncae TaxID=2594267 RepID=UPI0012661DEA|nr:UvrD-helicase domain-containing protein [Microlunatus speluncae]